MDMITELGCTVILVFGNVTKREWKCSDLSFLFLEAVKKISAGFSRPDHLQVLILQPQ
jgi:hypothetical protein